MNRPLAWGAMDSKLGRVYVAAGPGGAVMRLTYGIPELQFLKELGETSRNGGSGEPVWDPGFVAPILKQLEEYFAGKRREFDLDVDLGGLTPFQRSVLEVTRRIPYGEFWTYREVAAAIGNPQAARAVGHALARNPVGIIVPCHRVIGSDGSLRGFTASGGLSAKRYLLELEGCFPKQEN